MKLTRSICSVALALPLLVGPAAAHHSFAMFDRSKTVSVTGAVKEFDMINPHGWLQILVPDAQGQVHEWALETGGTGQMARTGWTDHTVAVGDKVTVEMHPLKDGSNGGQLVSVVLPNGKTLGGNGRGGFGGGF